MIATLKSPPAAKSVLVVDDVPVCRQMAAGALRAAGYVVHAAEDGSAAVTALEELPIDLILLDFEMPGMGGGEFLRMLRADPRWRSLPVVMLTNNSSTQAITEAARYGVRGYMVKSRFSGPLLIKRVQAALAAQPASLHAVGREKTIEAVAEIASARTLVGVVSELVAIANSPRSHLSDLAVILRQEPVIAARVLQVAASPAYAASKNKLTNIDDAVRILGASGVRDIALSAGVFEAFASDDPHGLDALRSWQHAFAVANIMRRIVPRGEAIPDGAAYLAGLFHDLPEVILRQRFPAPFAAAAEMAARSGQPAMMALEPVFGITYVELVDEVFGRIKLPPVITHAIREYFQLQAGEETQDPIAHALGMADGCAHGLLLTPWPESVVAPVLASECRSFILSPAQINGAEVRAEAITTSCVLAKIPSQKQRELMKPLLAETPCRIAYVRSGVFADLDPLDLALESLCNVERFTRTPKGDELTGLKAVVLVGDAEAPGKSLPALKVSPAAPISLTRLHQFLQSVQ